MNNINDKEKKYLNMLGKEFNENEFKEFINDLLNLKQENIVNNLYEKLINDSYNNYIDKTYLYANYIDSNDSKIGVFIIKLKEGKTPSNARTLQRNYISNLMDDYDLNASLSAIYGEDDTWRFSFVKKDLKIELGKINYEVTPAKRYSYLFGKNEPTHTAKVQLLELLKNNQKQYTIEDIEKQFSVENVSEDFFKKYKEKYLELKKYLELNDKFKEEMKKCDFTSEEFAKKILGQIIFLYFLQKKGWLGMSLIPNKLKNEEYEEIYNLQKLEYKKILKQFYIPKIDYNILNLNLIKDLNNYSSEIDILINIFTDTKYDMNWGNGKKDFIRYIYNDCELYNKNFFDDYLEPFFYLALNKKRKNQYFRLFNCKIPFLNGGLFEPLKNYNWENTKFNIPNEFFYNSKEEGILDVFDRYNFTIDEDEPLEKDVAIDPEMLGKIFERLMDKNDQKGKGAFYTPSDIVHYMCEESISRFISNKIKVDYNEIKEFVIYGDIISDLDTKEGNINNHLIGDTVFNNIIQIDDALKNIKVADPAVGSGAFPLGMLNEIVKVRNIITKYLLIYNKIGKFENKIKDEEIILKRNIFNMKWNTIKNCIYAVDIENSAVDIAKLRLWLSLVVDQNEVGKEGPQTLPNLECKIMQGNSLIDEYKGKKLIDEEFIHEIKNGESLKINSNNSKTKKKYRDENQIEIGWERKSAVENLINIKRKLYDVNDYKEKKKILDSVYLARKGLLNIKFRENNDDTLFHLVDKSHSKPYFSWMLEFIEVFVENDGFDIVIGNPPYVGEGNNKEIFEVLKKSKYYEGKMNFWYFFGCLGIDLLNKNGVEVFIAPNNWITNTGAKKFRNKIIKETEIKDYINFSNYNVFENAKIQVMIYVLNKTNPNEKYNINYKKILDKNIDKIELKKFLYKEKLDCKCFEKYKYEIEPYRFLNKYIEFLPKEVKYLTEKMELNNNPYFLDENEIAQGIVTPQDCVNKKSLEVLGSNFKLGEGIFVLSLEELNSLNLTDYEKKYIKPFYTSKEIKKWNIEEENNYYIIYSDKELVADIEKCINIKNHLDKYKNIITSDNKPYGLHRPRNKENFIGEKIISARKCITPTFTYTDLPTYVSQTFNIIKPNKINIKYLLGILNSDLIKFWLKYKGKMQGENFQIDKEPLTLIPIVLNKKYEEKLIKEVEKILFNNKKENNEINNIVYKIYGFNEKEIEEVEKYL